MLTEVGNATDIAELNAEIANLGVTCPHVQICVCSDTSTQQHVAILSNIPLGNLVTPVPGRAIYDPELDEAGEEEDDTGISKGMAVTFQFQAATFHLFGLHLKSERRGNESDAQRIAQASIVRRHYLAALNAGEHVIVAGDLNDQRAAVQKCDGFEGGTTSGETCSRPALFCFFGPNELDSRWTYEFRGKREQIDHIPVSRSLRQGPNSISAEVPDQPNALASDHRAVVVHIVVP